MTENSSVEIKGTSDGIILIISEKNSIEKISEDLKNKFSLAGDFFKGTRLKVKYRGKNLSQNEEKVILDTLVSFSGADIESFEKEIRDDMVNNQNSMKKRISFYLNDDESMCKFISGTVRSGNLIKYDGTVVILGDVNPGAEIVAAGNIVVLGTLRGVVHAGCNGDRTKVIAAVKLKATQIRIADLITRCPDDTLEAIYPEKAYIKENNIIVDRIG